MSADDSATHVVMTVEALESIRASVVRALEWAAGNEITEILADLAAIDEVLQSAQEAQPHE